MGKKRPKVLYSFDLQDHKIQKHVITDECMPQRIVHERWVPGANDGDQWRCRCDSHDVYGWDTLKAAKEDDVDNIRKEIARLQAILVEKTKKESPEQLEVSENATN